MENRIVKCQDLNISNSNKICLIAGPCQLETEQHALDMAGEIKNITDKYKIGFIYKTSFDKANRTSLKGKRGAGLEKSLPVFDKIKNQIKAPVLTDIHNEEQCSIVAPHVDVLQIPAFLCRQTDLLVAAAKTNKEINLKKGQFMSPESMQFAVKKIVDSGNQNVMITDRGTMFGYQDLVVDFRGIPTMKSYATTVLDVTHSLQKPNQTSGVTGGLPEMIETIARAGVVNGVDGLFIETHFDPKNALSDGKNMLPIDELEEILGRLVSIRKTINSFNS